MSRKTPQITRQNPQILVILHNGFAPIFQRKIEIRLNYYTIVNHLGLNTELTKAIAIGHDLGHAPFGHQGEFILSTISEREYNKNNVNAPFGMPENWKCEIPYYGDINQHRNVIENVANAILKDTPLIAPMEEGIRGLELGNSMLLAGLKDKVVTLPMDADEYAAELEKLIATSRYQKKTVAAEATAEDMSKSF